MVTRVIQTGVHYHMNNPYHLIVRDDELRNLSSDIIVHGELTFIDNLFVPASLILWAPTLGRLSGAPHQRKCLSLVISTTDSYQQHGIGFNR